MSLLDLIKQEISESGPMPLARYMELCLTHSEFGYYMTRDPFGAAGDFTTAPEISQLFGEMLGLWCVAKWEAMGKPEKFNLVEFGPGRGTLMADALRAARVRPAFLEAMSLHLCDASPILREHQHAHLARYQAQWIEDISALDAAPTIFIANEFFDALPVTQVHHTDGWRQQAVTLAHGKLDWTSLPAPDDMPANIAATQSVSIIEYCPLAQKIMADITSFVAQHNGAALLVDYAYNGPKAGDSLQALRQHEFCDPLAQPGEADLTCHVDFGTLAAIAHAHNCRAEIIPQGAFLGALGIHARAAKLIERDENRKDDIISGLNRLTAPTEMGELFKVLLVEKA